MNVKEYLGQVKCIKDEIYKKQDEINTMRDMLVSTTAHQDDVRVQSSSDPDKIAVMIANILERESEIQELVEKFCEKERTISNQIDGLDNPRHRDVLYWRYIKSETFERIADQRINLSWRQTIRLHGKALLKFSEKYLEKERKNEKIEEK